MTLESTRQSLYYLVSGALVPGILPSLSTEYWGSQATPDSPNVCIILPQTTSDQGTGLVQTRWELGIGLWRADLGDLGDLYSVADALRTALPPHSGGLCASGESVTLDSIVYGIPEKSTPGSYRSQVSGYFVALGAILVTLGR